MFRHKAAVSRCCAYANTLLPLLAHANANLAGDKLIAKADACEPCKMITLQVKDTRAVQAEGLAPQLGCGTFWPLTRACGTVRACECKFHGNIDHNANQNRTNKGQLLADTYEMHIKMLAHGESNRQTFATKVRAWRSR